MGDQQITLGSLENEDSVAQEADGNDEKRFEEKSQMKRSFILEKESTFEGKQGNLTQRSAPDYNIASKFYNNFLNGFNGAEKKNEIKETENSDMFMSDECDEKRSFTPQPRIDSMLEKHALSFGYRGAGF